MWNGSWQGTGVCVIGCEKAYTNFLTVILGQGIQINS